MCFLLVNLVHKIINKRYNKDVFAISIHLEITVTTLRLFRYENGILMSLTQLICTIHNICMVGFKSEPKKYENGCLLIVLSLICSLSFVDITILPSF